ncbi:hypothetical protein LVJ94_49575 [Pendulispora rubella]|uniref:Rubrerythrin diiron-binding domain-containing protein n=1 Tax=Pendulispora rubella TaxID=2741070 RepID=A0ABZ2L6T3_9BACT
MMGTLGKEQAEGFPLDNLTYDLLTIVHAKSKALEAYGRYCDDARQDSDILRILEQIKRDDANHVRQLSQHLARCLGGPQQGTTAESRSPTTRTTQGS